MRQLFIFILLFATNISASAQSWYPSGAPNGRDINAIKIFHPDTVVVAGGWKFDAGDSTRSIFRSENGGLYLWNVAMDDNKHWITSLDFTDSQNGIAVAAGGQILHTANGGWNWTVTNAPIDRDLNEIFFIDAQNMIIVGGRKGDSTQSHLQTILRSTNGGQSWTVVLDQQGFWLKSVYFPTPTTGYAVGDSSTLLKTTNGGLNWSPVTAPLQRNFNAIWFRDATNGFIAGGYPSNDSITTILQTTDGGNTWTINTDQMGGMLRDIHFASANTGYAVGDYNTVLKTTNGGAAWNAVTIPGTNGTEQYHAVRFYDENFGYVSGQWGVQYIYNNEAVPEASTAGSIVADTAVTLSGYVNTFDEIAAVSFVFSYDFDSAYYETSYASIVKSNSPVLEQQTFTDLEPNRLYYYLIKAWTMGGTAYGDTLTFYTGTATSEIETQSATNVTQTGATLAGSIRGFSNPINLFFEYGTAPSFGNQVAATPASVNDTALQFVTADLTALQPNTIYYFRIKGISGSSAYYGNTLTFYTGQQALYSMLQTLPATGLLDTGATLNAVVSGFNINADISFDYSANINTLHLSTPVVAFIMDSAQHTISTNISNLSPATLYYYRVKAVTALGTFYGDTLSFYSALTGNYTIKTNAATAVSETSAQLHGEVSRLPQNVTLRFDYGVTMAMTDFVAGTPSSVNDTGTHAIAAALTGLQPNTLYYYRLRAQIPSGALFYGETRQIYTSASPIPNWDFQLWEDRVYDIPKNWNILGDDFERVSGLTGNSLKIKSTTMAILGVFYDNGAPEASFIGGVPFQARPDSISFRANYDIQPGDSAIFVVHLYDAAYTNISTAFYLIGGNSNGQFTRLSFPVSYNSPLTPDSIVVAFIPTTPERGANTNFMIIDDISAVPASLPVIENGDFETWENDSAEVLSGWFYPNHIKYNTVRPNKIVKGLFNAPDDYAAVLENVSFGDSRWIGAEISNKTGVFDKSEGGFPVSAKHQSMNGYFKWLPQGNDTMVIDLVMRNQGQQIGGGQFTQISPVSDYTMFDLPITYSVPGVDPDTAEITIRSYFKNPARGNSLLYIDKLSFDGFVGIGETNGQPGNQQSLAVYPNPASADLVIQLQKPVKGTLHIYDLSGAVIYSRDFSGTQTTIDTREFSKGFYFVSIQEGNKRLVNRFIVVR